MSLASLLLRVTALGCVATIPARGETPPCPDSVIKATLAEPGAKTPEISTDQLREILAARSAVLLDTRPHLEWAISHLPSALNVAPKPGMPMSLYTSDVAEIGRLVKDDRTRALVLYCNGPFCGKSKRVSDDLLKAGYSNVRRYQLGAPVWRALGGIQHTEPPAGSGADVDQPSSGAECRFRQFQGAGHVGGDGRHRTGHERILRVDEIHDLPRRGRIDVLGAGIALFGQAIVTGCLGH